MTELHEVILRGVREHDYVVYVFAYNEGDLLRSLMEKFPPVSQREYDVMIGDDGSTDGVVTGDFLEVYGVRGATRLARNMGLSKNIQVALQWLQGQGYKGVVFINGNDRDNPEAIPRFLGALENGFGYVQGSRFVAGGRAVNTPLVRHLAIRFLHAPLFSLLVRQWMTDTTNGFRAFSSAVLFDQRCNFMQEEFKQYEIEQYLGWKAKNMGYRITEVPVTRAYPEGSYTSHIRPGMGWWHMLRPLLELMLGKYA